MTLIRESWTDTGRRVGREGQVTVGQGLDIKVWGLASLVSGPMLPIVTPLASLPPLCRMYSFMKN